MKKLKKRIPEPAIVAKDIGYNLTAYAWEIDCNGLRVLGDTKAEAIALYRDAIIFEYGVAV